MCICHAYALVFFFFLFVCSFCLWCYWILSMNKVDYKVGRTDARPFRWFYKPTLSNAMHSIGQTTSVMMVIMQWIHGLMSVYSSSVLSHGDRIFSHEQRGKNQPNWSEISVQLSLFSSFCTCLQSHWALHGVRSVAVNCDVARPTAAFLSSFCLRFVRKKHAFWGFSCIARVLRTCDCLLTLVRVGVLVYGREITYVEQSAAVRLSAFWRGYYVRKINDARLAGMSHIMTYLFFTDSFVTAPLHCAPIKSGPLERRQ